MDFLDAAWRSATCKHSNGTCPSDLKIAFGHQDSVGPSSAIGTLAELLGLGQAATQKYNELMGLHPGNPKIALRRTEGPVPGCIGFHCN